MISLFLKIKKDLLKLGKEEDLPNKEIKENCIKKSNKKPI